MHLARNVLTVLASLDRLDLKLSDLILSLLLPKPEELDSVGLNAVNNLASNLFTILNAFRLHFICSGGTRQWISHYASEYMIEDVNRLTHVSTGWHGNAQNARIDQFESLEARSIANTAKFVAPNLWAFFDRILCKSDSSKTEIEWPGDQSIEGDPTSDRGLDRVAKLRELVCQFIY